MKELVSKKILLYNRETGQYEPIDAIRGESAYETAYRLGLTSLSEEEWIKQVESGQVSGDYVKTVNNQRPDENGNIQIDTSTGTVQSIDGIIPDETGNVQLNAAKVDTYTKIISSDEFDALTTEELTKLSEGGVQYLLVETTGDEGTDPIFVRVDKQMDITDEQKTVARENIGALSVDDTISNSNLLGGKPPSAYTAVNLLVNSDWRVKENIVNQRGRDSYVGSGIYTIDQWRHWGDTAIGLVINDGYITVGNAISQDVPRKNISPGMEYTIGYKTRSNVIMAFPFSIGDVGATVTVGNLNVTLTDSVLSVTINGGEYQWAALYEGSYTAETLPPFVPPDPVLELQKCQTTFYQIDAYSPVGFAYSAGSTDARVAIALPVNMRVIPSIQEGATFTLVGGGLSKTVTDITVASMSNNIVRLNIKTDGLNINDVYTAYTQATPLQLMADIK